MAGADFAARHLDDGILRMHLAVDLLKRLRYALYALHNIKHLKIRRINGRGIAEQAKDCGARALRIVNRQTPLFDAANEPRNALLRGVGL